MTTVTTTGRVPVRTHPVGDTLTMLQRNLLRLLRYPSLTLMLVGIPVLLLLLFVYVFGGAFGAGVMPGIEPGAAGRAAYLEYITPAVMLLGAAGVAQGTAIGVSMDVTGGIFARFRTMAIAPVSILGGHVLAATLQTLLTMGVTLGVAVLLGFRPGAGPLDWLGLFGTLALLSLALTWLSVAMGISARTVESASNTPMVLMLLPFLSSGFVPVETMPTVVRWFAEYQPFTPLIDVVRGLLDGSGPGAGTVALAVGWCAVLALAGYGWARAGYRRERSG